MPRTKTPTLIFKVIALSLILGPAAFADEKPSTIDTLASVGLGVSGQLIACPLSGAFVALSAAADTLPLASLIPDMALDQPLDPHSIIKSYRAPRHYNFFGDEVGGAIALVLDVPGVLSGGEHLGDGSLLKYAHSAYFSSKLAAQVLFSKGSLCMKSVRATQDGIDTLTGGAVSGSKLTKALASPTLDFADSSSSWERAPGSRAE